MNTSHRLKLLLIWSAIHFLLVQDFTCEAENLIFIDSPETGHEDISDRILSVSPNTRIIIAPGSYLLDNPITIEKNNVHILGNSRRNTFFTPKNPGKPVFVIKADNIVVRKLTINARVLNGSGRASFAVYVETDSKNVEISETRIMDTGASSVIAPQTDGIKVSSNLIINAGDDAIRIRGSDVMIIDNIIIRYFDEAIDIAGGANHLVIGNYVESGRIGIVLDDSVNPLVFGNLVKDNLQQGIVVESEKNGSITGNILIDNGDIGIKLYSPSYVASNKVIGSHDVGLMIHDMDRGTLEKNVVIDSNRGIVFYNCRDSSITHNEYCTKEMAFVDEVAEAGAVIRSDNKSVCAEKDRIKKDLAHVLAKEDRSGLIRSAKGALFTRATDNEHIEIEGNTNKNEEIAEKIARFLKKNNPGFLSIEVYDDSMTSEITEELFTTLKGSGDLGIGLVRWPYLMFKSASDSLFPEWHLEVSGQRVALISYVTSGANVKMYINSEDGFNFENVAEYVKHYVINRIQNFATRLRFRLPDLIAI